MAQKCFYSSTWTSFGAQLDYFEEPDMFHDTFGHLPLLLDSTYAQFMEEFGKLGVNHIYASDIEVLDFDLEK